MLSWLELERKGRGQRKYGQTLETKQKIKKTPKMCRVPLRNGSCSKANMSYMLNMTLL